VQVIAGRSDEFWNALRLLFTALPDETDGLSKILRVGEDLAKAADAYRVARHDLEKAEEIGATDMQGLHDDVADCWRNLGRAIHEFRKQSKRVSGSPLEP